MVGIKVYARAPSAAPLDQREHTMRLNTARPSAPTPPPPAVLNTAASSRPAAATPSPTAQRSLQADTFTPATAQRSTAVGSRVQAQQIVRRGDTGPAVSALQGDLAKLGYLRQSEVDGDFGPRTEAAVKSFQKDKGLEQDGVVGPNTRGALDKALAAPSGPSTWTPAPALADVKAGRATLKKGMEGEAVRHLQSQLARHGHLSGSEVDGKFGAGTEAAVKAFQKAKGLTPPPGQEGTVGKTTLEHLEKAPTTNAGGRISLAPRNMSQREKYDYYANIIRANGGQVNPNGQATVLGLRGVDANGNHHSTTFNKNYDDTFVVLKPNGTVEEFRGSTHSNPRYQPRAPDANGDGRGDLGMIRAGNYKVVPNGPHVGAASYHVRTLGGSGNLPAYRDTNQSNTISQAEKDAARARGYVQTEILFHQSGTSDNGSMGCQTLSSADYNRFIQAVGGSRASFTYTLVEANGGQ